MAVTKAKKTTKTSKPKYRSGLERKVAEDLQNRGVTYTYEGERIPYVVERKYIPDFQLSNGIYIEAKGFFKDEDCRKMKLLKAQHPDKEFRMLFQNPKTKVQSKRFTNAEWCERYGFQYCHGTVPQEWIDE